MKQNFGDYVRENRIRKMMKLKSFAERIGISAVYASYIENGKRPAPSEKVLANIATVLMLNPEEIVTLYSLAASSHKKVRLSDDLIDYINSNPSICKTLRAAKDKHIPESMWLEIAEYINKKPLQK